MATIFELRPGSGLGMFAVPYRSGRRGKAVRLLVGTIVEAPGPDRRREAPEAPDHAYEVGHGGVPSTIHHVNLGLISGYLPLSGIYLLPSGEVAAVYGAEVSPIGVSHEIAP